MTKFDAIALRRSRAYTARYGEEIPTDAPLPWNPVIETLLDHRSVRAFLPDALPDGVLQALVAAASSAPTSSNIQAWSVVAVSDPDRKARLADLAGNQQHIRDAPLLLVWLADLSRVTREAERRGVVLKGIDYTESFLLASFDAALAAQSALIAAESLGLGTVFIGALRNHPEEVAQLLHLPPRAYAVFGLVVGHPDPGVPTAVKPRLPQEVVLHHEVWSPQGDGGIPRHDEATLDFRYQQGLSAQRWSDLAVERLVSVEALKGRDRLGDALTRLGFLRK